MSEWIDGWMDGWVDGWVGGWVDVLVDGWVEEWVVGWIDGGNIFVPFNGNGDLRRLTVLINRSHGSGRFSCIYSVIVILNNCTTVLMFPCAPLVFYS